MATNKQDILYGNRVDIYSIRKQLNTSMEGFKLDKTISNRNKEFILKFMKDAELGKTIKNKQKKKIGFSRQYKYLYTLKIFASWLGKDFDKATQEDMERVISALENDKYRSKSGKPYSDETKADFKKMTKKFYKWLLGNNEHFPDIVSWFDTSVREKEIPALTKQEVEKMVEQSPNLLNKTAIMVLFDSGARIEEFLNIRLKHLTRKDDYYMVRIEYSKTKPRTISLPLCTKLLDELLRERNFNDPDELIFPYSYSAIRMALYRLGRKVLKKPVHPHLFRHSSATYYAGIEGNYFRFCKRYGWTFGSKMAQRYIDRVGIDQEETANAVKIDEISKVTSENQKLQESLKNLKSQYDEMYNVQQITSKTLLKMLEKQEGRKLYAKSMNEAGVAKEFLRATS